MEVKDHLSFERLQQLEREEKCAGRAKRLRIVVLAIQGWTAPAIGMAVGLSRRVCQQWVYRPNHYKSDPEAQQAFKEELPNRLDEIATKHPEKKLRVYFQDEARFGQQGTVTNVWAPKGSRPRAVRQTEYEYLWVLGAVCPETGHAEGLLSPRLNADVINIFLRQFSTTLASDEHAVMLWDGAGFHTAGAVEAPENVTLIQLPPYSPELNPMENLWHYLKSHYWSNDRNRPCLIAIGDADLA